MSRIDNRLIVELGAPREGPCVSFYFAAPPAGPEIQQGPVTLTNLVRDARRLLSEGGMREEEARRLLAPAERLVQDQAAWSQTGQGIAVFVAPGTMRTVRATPAFNTWLVIGRRFVTRPLLRAASDQVDFYVLALSQGSVRLLQVSGFDVEEINVPGMPAGIADILKYAELEAPPMEFHTAGRGRQRDAMAFHGTSEPTVTQKAAVRDLIRAVDNHVRPIVDAGSAPLVVAAVDYVQALYRESSSTKSLIDDRVTGNPDRLSNHQLAERARSPVLRQLASERREAAARYRELVNGPRSSDDAREILRAAHTGRVAELWVAEDAELWGTFDPGAGEMRTSADMAAHCDDLLDLAVVKTLENTGKVYAAALSEMPDPMPNNSPMAAAFRWP